MSDSIKLRRLKEMRLANLEKKFLDDTLRGYDHYVFINENGKAQVITEQGRWVAEHIRTAVLKFNYQVDEVQFPPIDDSGLASADQHATMKTADGGFLLEGRFEFRTITSPYQAEEMAEIILRRSRESLGLNLNVGFKAYELHIGDIVNISIASLGFSSKAFRVLAITFNDDYTIGLSLVEYQSSHYTWATKTQVASTPSTTL